MIELDNKIKAIKNLDDDLVEKMTDECGRLTGTATSTNCSLNSIEEQQTASRALMSTNQHTPTTAMELNLSLKWSIRESVISSLSQLSALLLYGDTMSTQIKETLNKKIDCLIDSLINLPLKLDQEAVDGEQSIDDLVFYITRDVRVKMIEQLIKNKDFGILYSQSVSNCLKKQLTVENNR